MLSDTARNAAYSDGIQLAADAVIKGGVVMDIGCGSGLLSLLSARTGARKVIAVEASDFYEAAEKVIAANGYSECIDVLHSRVEDVEDVEQVDCIVSEWMGTMLIFEFMVDSVLAARDRFLRPDGLMLPSYSRLLLTPVNAAHMFDDHVSFWKDKCGFDMSPLIAADKESKFSRPIHDWKMNPEQQLAEPQSIFEADMHTVTAEELEEIHTSVSFTMTRDDTCHGFGSWFNVEFWQSRHNRDAPVVLSTSPTAPYTHWKHTLLMLDEPLDVCSGDTMAVDVALLRNPLHRRHLRIHITAHLHRHADNSSHKVSKMFRLWR
ncbi:hypothetical protein, variant [Salpingoeca rosetta]|nr:hypothetical protein, variant [Salpingoeca rosetta]EGD73286.1 hypothetical protein, variant [Salpingoeca rosetta]|eukprot:XP_004994317.1 hypothetical protein, variant [Salpingoeca rosetta]